MKRICWAVAFLVLLGVPYNISVASATSDTPEEECDETLAAAPDFITLVTAEQIKDYYTKRYLNRKDAFNGCVLVAKDGVPIYKGAFGYANYVDKDSLTTESPIQLASTTKPFTATAILMLVEKGLLSVDDSLQKFFPDFPYQGVTVKNLLSHRSGLPEYIYWTKEFIGVDVKYLTNQSMLELLIKKKPAIRTRPDRMFIYCNTNYALLGCIIEKVSGLSYASFMEQHIFIPLGMNNTFALDIANDTYHCGTTCYQYGWRQWSFDFSDGVLGDKGIYSSVEDMLKWDNALKKNILVSGDALQEAYEPRSLDKYSFGSDKTRNYGYGWRMAKQADGNYMYYHNGNWHGCNNVYARDLSTGYTLIVLGNKFNENNYQTHSVWSIIRQMENARNIATVE